MNEITQIHLGRQAFTIAVDARKQLQEYLHAITKAAGTDVAEEVELRMVELLTERGIASDAVLLSKDITYLREQLGEPGDFSEAAEDDTPKQSRKAPRRLYRDTEHGMVAGVAAGLANFIGIDAVFIRIAFVAFTILGGWAAAMYVIMWLLVPEAKTPSDRLLMQGKAVTIEALKHTVDQADIAGTARRTGKTLQTILGTLFKIVLGVLGVAMVIAATGMLFALTGGGIYLALNHAALIPFNIFFAGTGDFVLTAAVATVIALIAVFLILIGTAMVRRKWRIPGWGVAALIGLFLLSLACAAALGADRAQTVHERYEAAFHETVKPLPPIAAVTVVGDNTNYFTEVEYKSSQSYAIGFRTMGNADASGVTTTVKDGLLTVDTSGFKSDPACAERCLIRSSQLKLVIYKPTADNIVTEGNNYLVIRPTPDILQPQN